MDKIEEKNKSKGGEAMKMGKREISQEAFLSDPRESDMGE